MKITEQYSQMHSSDENTYKGNHRRYIGGAVRKTLDVKKLFKKNIMYTYT